MFGEVEDRLIFWQGGSFEVLSITDIGKKRTLNQDYVYASDRPVGNLANVFLVADGMGGHRAGDYAASFTVRAILDVIRASRESEPVRLLGTAIRKANHLLRSKALEDDHLRGMGTTIVAATLSGRTLKVANVGDSRLYLLTEGEIVQVTRDHSLVQEMVRMGGLAPEAARTHTDRNIITRAVGGSDSVEVDFFELELEEESLILMCSDGLTNMLEDEEIRRIVRAAEGLEDGGHRLIEAANDRGGRDNIAVILINPFADALTESPA